MRRALGAALLLVFLQLCSALRTDAQSAPGDSAARLVARADILAQGVASDRRMAVDLLRQAAELFSKGGARRNAAATLYRIGALYGQGAQPDSALVYLRHALPIAHSTGDRATEGSTLIQIGAVYSSIGQPDSALAYFRQAMPIHAGGDRTGKAATLNGIGAVFAAIGGSTMATAASAPKGAGA